MRKPIMIANWKMHKTRDEALAYIYAINMQVPDKNCVETVLCVQAPILRDMVKRQGENLRVGAQNVHEQTSGAYTGEISAALLQNIGVNYVIIGHSERRLYFHESDETINLKMHQVLAHAMQPILCVGESLTTRENNQTETFIESQLEKAFFNINDELTKQIIIAYEPIWAIGTGINAEPSDANHTIRFIRQWIKNRYDEPTANAVRILYGGSVSDENIAGFIAESEIDGALVGGASLQPKTFLTLAQSAMKT